MPRRLAWAAQTGCGLGLGAIEAVECLVRRRRHGRSIAKNDPVERGGAGSDLGILDARPDQPCGEPTRGLQRIGLSHPCDGLVYVPAGYRPERPAPFLVMLHGASGVGLFALWPIIQLADAAGLIVLAPDARGWTWDRVLGSYGPDVAFVDRALKRVFSRYAVDRSHLAIGGFSDGASYALSLGLANGDLFSHVLAFSPGFMAPGQEEGRPRIFIAHGTEDRILPVTCSQRLVPLLRNSGYDVVYDEFVGPHVVAVGVAREAVAWLIRS